MKTDSTEHELLNAERRALLEKIEDALETPMLILGALWLALLVAEFALDWKGQWLDLTVWIIWAIFLFDFLLKFVLAPAKLEYLKTNWLTALSLLVPALRIFRFLRVLRILRFARATRGFRLLRVVSSLNRGMRALGNTMGRRGFGYVALLTLLVTFVGAAGIFAFERDEPNGLTNYAGALWWTAMLMTTLGSEYWPQSLEGRVLCFGLSLYAFAVFGYVTATVATFFIGRDAENPEAELASAASIDELKEEIRALRAEIRGFQENDLTADKHG